MSKRMNIDKWRVRKLAFPDGRFGTFPWYVIPPGVPTPRDVTGASFHFHDNRLTLWRSHRMALITAIEESRKV